MNATISFIAAGAFLVVLCSIPMLRSLAFHYVWVDVPRGRKQHEQPTPFVGGWAIFGGFWIAFGTCLLLMPQLRSELGDRILPMFLAHLVVFAGGVYDDFRPLWARYKLLIQTVAAVILWLGQLHIDTIYVPFVGSFPLAWPLSLLLTIIWVLMIVNAMNFMDGLNGLAGGLAVIAALGLLYTAIALKIAVVATIALITIAVTLGFLRYNFPKASVFLGDSGSQSLGFIFAMAAIYCPIKSYTVVAMFVPLLTLGVPLIDLFITPFRRVLTGKHLTRGDLGHIFHLLVRWGIGKTRTVLIFWSVALVLQVFAFTLFLFDRRVVFSILVAFMLIVAGWFLLLYRREAR